jgi:hypothetical protein
VAEQAPVDVQNGVAVLRNEHSELVAQAKQVVDEEHMGVVAVPSQGSVVVTVQSEFAVLLQDPAALQ